jgi:hypothetical protein
VEELRISSSGFQNFGLGISSLGLLQRTQTTGFRYELCELLNFVDLDLGNGCSRVY